MTHLFKVPLQFADIFVDYLDECQIGYSVRDKITGGLATPRRLVKYVVNEVDGKVHFDNRFISIPLFMQIYQTLFTNPESSESVNITNL